MSKLVRCMISFSTIVLFIISIGPVAEGKAYCDLDMDEGTVCMIAAYDLRPMQKAVGMRQVNASVADIQNMDADSLQDYINDEKIPIIVGPDGNFYMTDRHHMVFALYTAKGQRLPLLVAKVKKNWSHLSEQKFWRNMYQKNYVYLFDEFGLPLADHSEIPEQISDLKNDPYRSLAWAVRERDGFDKTDVLFAEFQWANYFRPRLDVGNTDREFERAVTLALQLAAHKDASHLPGFKN